MNEDSNKETCAVCNGKGRVGEIIDLGKCLTCNGTGKVRKVGYSF